jgi:KAP-like P-loop domain-containing protein
LGREYADKLGEWVGTKLGVNPVQFFKDARKAYAQVHEQSVIVSQKLLDAYYAQIDRAQDLLFKVFQDRQRITVVLIDELDRCDPDEAFEVIKQLRVFFAMRKLPIAFVVCANPEPIGLAIKHKYGLTTASGEYESRSILEKFVDVYFDMAEPAELGKTVEWLWNRLDTPYKTIQNHLYIVRLDAAYVSGNAQKDTVRNVTALQAMKTDNPFYSNLRLLQKTLDRANAREVNDKQLLWTAWHLELAKQMEPEFRNQIATASQDLALIAADALRKLRECAIAWDGAELYPQDNRGGTLFGLYRGAFWETCKAKFDEMATSKDPETRARARILEKWMTDFRRMDFLAIMTLVPLESNTELNGEPVNLKTFILDEDIQSAEDQLGYLLATY